MNEKKKKKRGKKEEEEEEEGKNGDKKKTKYKLIYSWEDKWEWKMIQSSELFVKQKFKQLIFMTIDCNIWHR